MEGIHKEKKKERKNKIEKKKTLLAGEAISKKKESIIGKRRLEDCFSNFQTIFFTLTQTHF